MNRKIIKIPGILSLVAGLVLFAMGCEKEETVKEFDTGPYEVYITADSIPLGFSFYPVEARDTFSSIDTAKLKLRFETDLIFPCFEREIAVTTFTNGTELIIRFDSVYEYCSFSVTGPASRYVLLPEETERLILVNGNEIDAYDVSISSEKVSMTDLRSRFTTLEYDELFRYPENSFVYICKTSREMNYFYDDFLFELTSNIYLREHKFIGEGVLPYPDSAYGYSNVNPVKYFIYQDESDFRKAGELLESFSSTYITPADPVRISLINWKNEQYLSW